MDDKDGESMTASKSEPAYLTSFLRYFESETPKRVAIFTHSNPDPDAIGSMMAVEWMLRKLCNAECTSFYNGSFSHPQNMAMVNLIDPNLRPITEYQKDNFDLRILVDTVPANAGILEPVSFDICIDHHREIPNGGFNGLFINLKAGSCCATVYHLIKKCNLHFEDDNDTDSGVATAVMVGISTDTESLMSDDTSEYEFAAWSELFPFRNAGILKKIVNFERPKFWINHKAEAVNSAIVSEGVGVVGLGIIPACHRDMIADMAQEMISWEDVNTAVVFAVVEGERIEGSVRSRNASVMVPALCDELGGKHGKGGGKLGKGAYRYTLGGVSFDEEDDEETRNKVWTLLNEKETKRIIRTIRK